MVTEEQLSLIYTYFPTLSEEQKIQIKELYPLYTDWNSKINVISRKDISNLYLHHVLHSLALVKLIDFAPESKILDLGTGGGFPGVPLAIYYPDVHFHLIDARAKKLKVVREISDKIGLKNISVEHTRVEDLKGKKYDFVLSRAVTELNQLIKWSRPLLNKDMKHALPNGLITYTGGKIDKKLAALPKKEYVETYAISDFFDEDYFSEKYLVYIQG